MTLTLTASPAPDEPEAQRRQANKKERNKDAGDVHPRSRETCNDEKGDSSDAHRQHDKDVNGGAVLAWAASGEKNLGNELKEMTHVVRVVANLTTQAQRPGARDATLATASLTPGSLQAHG